MKKLFIFIILGLILFPGTNYVLAADQAGSCDEYCIALSDDTIDDLEPPMGQVCICNPLKAEGFENIINNIIDFIFKIAIVLAPLMIVIGGFMFLTSSGDLQKVSQARKLMIWAAVGFIIVLLAKGFMSMLESILGI